MHLVYSTKLFHLNANQLTELNITKHILGQLVCIIIINVVSRWVWGVQEGGCGKGS